MKGFIGIILLLICAFLPPIHAGPNMQELDKNIKITILDMPVVTESTIDIYIIGYDFLFVETEPAIFVTLKKEALPENAVIEGILYSLKYPITSKYDMKLYNKADFNSYQTTYLVLISTMYA